MEKVEVAPQIVAEKEKIADPAPLGLAAFALTTFVASAHFAGAHKEGKEWLHRAAALGERRTEREGSAPTGRCYPGEGTPAT